MCVCVTHGVEAVFGDTSGDVVVGLRYRTYFCLLEELWKRNLRTGETVR